MSDFDNTRVASDNSSSSSSTWNNPTTSTSLEASSGSSSVDTVTSSTAAAESSTVSASASTTATQSSSDAGETTSSEDITSTSPTTSTAEAVSTNSSTISWSSSVESSAKFSSQIRFSYATRPSSATYAASVSQTAASSATLASPLSPAAQGDSQAQSQQGTPDSQSQLSSTFTTSQAVQTAFTTVASLYITEEASVVTTTSGTSVITSTTTRKAVTKTTLVTSAIYTTGSVVVVPYPGVSTGSGGSSSVSQDNTDLHGGIDAGAKAGIGIGLVAAVVAVIVALHYITRHYRQKRSVAFLMRSRASLKPFPVRKDEFKWEDLDRSGGTSGVGSKKKEEQAFSEKSQTQFFREVMSNPITAFSPTRKNNRDSETPMWMRSIGLGRPPVPDAIEAIRTAAVDVHPAEEAIRVSVIAPSESSSAGFIDSQQRPESRNSGNHLHPLFLHNSFPSPTFSQHSQQSQQSQPSPSSSLENLTRSFPMPAAMSRTHSEQNLLPNNSHLQPAQSPVKLFASNNPFRNSVGASSLHSGDYRHSLTTPSVNGDGNPFELDFESSEPNLELDFTKLDSSFQAKRNRVMSGMSYYNPTTPVTPHNYDYGRRGSNMSNVSSVYSADGGGKALPAPWPPLEVKSPARSRAMSEISARSRARSITWADDLQITPVEPEPRTFSTILDAYAGRAI